MKKLLLFIMSSAFLVSCEDFFNQVVDIEVPESQPKIVLKSTVVAGDDQVKVFVSKSRGITDDSPFEFERLVLDSFYQEFDSTWYVYSHTEQYDTVGNATVELYKNGTLVGPMQFTDPGFYYIGEMVPDDGTKPVYTIKVSAPGYTPVEATQTLPSTPVSVTATYDPEYVSNGFEDVTTLTIEIEDKPGEENYYQLKAYYQYDTLYEFWNREYLMSADPLVSRTNEGLILSDKSFDGKKYAVRTHTHSQFTTGRIRVVVESLTKDDYQYLISEQLYYNSEGNPFAEPTIIHTNVINGYGIFSIRALTEEIIQL